MPELPEVETIVNDLNKNILNLRIVSLKINKDKIVKSGAGDLRKMLVGKSFLEIKRRAKFLVFKISGTEEYLIVHLRMTGQFIYKNKKKTIAGGHEQGDEGELSNKHSHIIINFEDGSKLYYNDMRQFGFWKLVSEPELEAEFANFGAEPLLKSFNFKKFYDLSRNKNTNIKAFLLNQKYVSGLGNIYVDEILFNAGISPKRKVSELKKKELEKIFYSIKKILRKAIKNRGTTFSDYRDLNNLKGNYSNLLKVYGREGKKCLKCKKTIKKIRLAGRGTYYCNVCQK